MTDIDVWGLVQAILASIGGGALLIFGFSSFLATVMSKRIIQNEKAQQTIDLEKLKNELKSETDKEIALLQSRLKTESDVEIEKLKHKIDAQSHKYKLNKTHEHEQKVKIKNVISKNKITLINAAETLDSRLWNFMDNHNRNWHVNNEQGDKYYLKSFVYRLLVFFGVSYSTEKEMIFLDSTVAEKQDLDFLKFLKVFQLLMTDVSLFDGQNYDSKMDSDHFFKDNFIAMVGCVLEYDNDTQLLKSIKAYDSFINDDETQRKADKLVDFVSGLTPSNELRWSRMLSLHLVINAFLEEFGYDFNKVSDGELINILKHNEKNICLENLWALLKLYKLDTNESVLKVFGKFRCF
ncbi:MAG: hypothetical protein GY730_04705 [bacterium]|uniref:hypothetical protein n=1 Tax=Pseudoalteromonas sp. bablab_jr010 TaxID=2755063 RepID=UPI0018F360AC|nr:hypothetical protein [Pseudoalteromonas sp. bablab_jr010]MCP4049987.1 hypothetical protein [bacterium]